MTKGSTVRSNSDAAQRLALLAGGRAWTRLFIRKNAQAKETAGERADQAREQSAATIAYPST